MTVLTFELPAMYGDHHVIEVRRLLFALPGVEDVQASSGFHLVEVRYDPATVDAEQITAALAEAGYTDDLPIPMESSDAVNVRAEGTTHFRHTAAYEQTGKVVGFAQRVEASGRPLWPCPGFGAVKMMD